MVAAAAKKTTPAKKTAAPGPAGSPATSDVGSPDSTQDNDQRTGSDLNAEEQSLAGVTAAHDEGKPFDAKAVVKGHNYDVGSKAAVRAQACGNPVMADTNRTWAGQTATEASEEATRARTHLPRFGDDALSRP